MYKSTAKNSSHHSYSLESNGLQRGKTKAIDRSIITTYKTELQVRVLIHLLGIVLIRYNACVKNTANIKSFISTSVNDFCIHSLAYTVFILISFTR